MEADHPLAVAFERYAPQLRRYLWTRTGDIHAVDDLLQLTFLEALRAWDRYEDRGWPLSSWLYAIARSRLSDHQRLSARRRHETELEVWHASGDDLEQLAERNEERDRLWAAVAKLPHRQRVVVELRFRDDWPLDDVAAALGVTVGSVKAMQHRATQALTLALGGELARARVGCAVEGCERPIYQEGRCWRCWRAAQPRQSVTQQRAGQPRSKVRSLLDG